MTDEQRVRTMAGWIGVEISRSRVRTPGKAGYGLYRVRPKPRSTDLPEDLDEMWTGHLFGLNVIEAAIRNSIDQGTPAGPMALHLVEDASAVKTGEGGYAAGHVVPTRWTSAYRGRRNLGLAADLEELERTDPVVGAASARLDETTREILDRSTVRGRQREANAEFQRDHLERRRHGLEARYRAKSARNANQDNSE